MKFKGKEVQASQFFKDKLPYPEGVLKEWNDFEQEYDYYLDYLDYEDRVGDGWWIVTLSSGRRISLEPEEFEDMYEVVKQ